MEMRVTEYQQELGQVISMEDFESFILGSEMGLRLIISNEFIREVDIEEIINKLNLNTIEEIYYIENNNSVKIVFKNGCINELERV